MSQTIDVSKQEQERLNKEAEAKAAAEQAIKDEAARQAAEVAAKFGDYEMQRAALEAQREQAQRESYQSGVEVRKDNIGKMVPVSPGASKGRLVFEDQVFPVYSTRLTEEGQRQYDEATAKLEALQATHQASMSDPKYKQLSEQYTTQANRAHAETKLQELKQKKAYIESFPSPQLQGAHISDTQRRNVAEAQAKRSHEISQLESQIQQAESYLQSTSIEALSLQSKPFEGMRYSSPTKAAGYNPMTGRVELGAGDTRGTVVSQSAAEDRMDLERIKKEAGYTGKATIDPRIAAFKTVDTGILTPGIAAQPSPDILRAFGQPAAKPQHDRKSILTDQPDSKYANPNFVTKEKQSLLDQKKQGEPTKNYQVSLFEVPQMYELTIDGKKLTVTAQQAQAYQDTFQLGQRLYEFKQKKYYEELGLYAKDLKSQGIKEVPVLTEGKTVFVPVDSLVSRMKRISAKDPEARITAFVPLSESLQVGDAPMSLTGVKQDVSGRKTSLVSTPPPAPPKYELVSFIPLSLGAEASELRGIGTFKEQGQVLVTTKSQLLESESRTTEAREQFNKLLKQVEEETRAAGASGDYLGQFFGEIKKDVLTTVAETQNIFTKYAVEPVQAFRYKQTQVPFAPLQTQKTLTGVAVGGAFASAAKLAPLTPLGPILKPSSTLTPKNSTEIIQEAATDAGQTFESEVIQSGSQYVQTYGPGTIIGAIVGGVLPGSERAVPLRVVRIAPTIAGAPKVVSTAVKLGYGTGVSRLEIGRITESGKFYAGIPKPSSIPSITKIGFSGPVPRGGYAITEDTSRYMTRPATLDYLVEKKVLRRDEADLIQATERRLKLTEKYPDEILRSRLPDQPVRALEPTKAETGAFFAGTEKSKTPLYGSITEQFYMGEKYLEQSRDVDIHITGRGAGEKATRIATEIAEEIQAKTRPERQFFVKTKIDDEIDITTGKPTGKKEVDRVVISVTTTKPEPKRDLLTGEGKEKVSEFIVKSPQSATKEGYQATDMNKVLGFKVPSKTVKSKMEVSDVYKGKQSITPFRRQELRRSSAMLEIQQPKRGGVLRPDPGREKEFTKVVGQSLTRAEQAEKMGRPKEAAELRAYAEQVKIFAKARGLWSEGLKVEMPDESGVFVPESKLSSAASAISKEGPRPIPKTFEDDESVTPTPPERNYTSVLSKVSGRRSSITSSAVSSASRAPSRSSVRYSILSKAGSDDSILSKAASESQSMGRSRASRSDSGVSHDTLRYGSLAKTAPSRLAPSRAAPSRVTPSLSRLGVSTAAPSRATVTPSRATLIRTTPQNMIPKPPVRIPIIPIDKIKQKTDKERERAEKERADFIGQAKVSDVVGFGRRGDITYGRSLTAKLAGRDVRESGRRSGSFVKSRSVSLLDRTKPAILKQDKKKRGFKF